MKQRLFLNRVYINGTRIAINDGAQDAIYVDSDPAVAALAGCNDAFPWTQLALDLLIHKTPSQILRSNYNKVGQKIGGF